MNRLVRLIAIIFITMSALCVSTQAQGSYATGDYGDAMMANMVRMQQFSMMMYGRNVSANAVAAMEGKSGSSAKQIAEQKAAQAQFARGKQVIASGRATTEVQALGTMSVPQEFAAQVKMTPEYTQRFTEAIKQMELSYQKEAKQNYGLPGNDLATATAALIDICRQVGAGEPELTPKQFASLQNQLRERLLKAEYLQGMSVSERRKGYEGIVMAMGMTVIGVQEAQQTNDPEQMKQAKEFASQMMKTLTSLTPEQVSATGEKVVLAK